MTERRYVKLVIFAVQLAACLSQGTLAVAGEWVRVESGSVELITDVSSKTRHDLLSRAELVRGTLAAMQMGPQTPSRPLRIIAFRSEEEYATHRAHIVASAYYVSSSDRDYIVLGGRESRFGDELQHEYTHYFIHQKFSSLPIWLDEGLAVLVSTVDHRRNQVR